MLDDPMSCPICTGKAEFELLVDIFGELPRKLNRCTVCKSCFYRNPDWLVRAYSDVISTLDTGISERADDIANILTLFSLDSKYQGVKFLDFGGGTGLLARKLRDRGFDWYSTDPLARSTIPLPKVESSSSFAIVSLIEVLEHIQDPLSCLRSISAVTDTIFISTQIATDNTIDPSWWYLQPESGQHIFFLSSAGLEKLGELLHLNVYSNGSNLHVLSRNPISVLQKFSVKFQRLAWMVGLGIGTARRSKSLSVSDHLQAKSKLQNTVQGSTTD